MDFDAVSDLSSPLSSLTSSPLSSPPNSPILPATWRSLTPPPSQENADDDMAPARKRRKVEPKARTTQHLDLSSDTSQSEYDHRVALDLLLKALRKRKKIVVIAGAGISVSAGIPDFRSSHGLFKTLRSEHKLKASGKELFDASVYKDDSSTSSFHDMVRDLSNMAAKATPTPFHHLLARLAQEGRLLRLYTQNVDGIDTSLPPLATQVPLNHKGPWPQTIQLHGGLEKMMCQKCRHTSDFQADLFQGPKPPLCPECQIRDALRTRHAGKRSHGIGKLRPRIVLYNEHNPDEEAIGAVMTSDLRSRPDAIIVVGTSMKIPGVKRIVREMCGVVRSKQNGVSMWINQDPVPPGKEFEDCWDLVVTGQCDEVARRADFKNWDDCSPAPVEYSMSEGERVKCSQSKFNVVIPKTPTNPHNKVKQGPLDLGGMMTPPVSMDEDRSDRLPVAPSGKKVMKNSPAKTKLKSVVQNPASSGRSISEVLGKENKAKQRGPLKSRLTKKALPTAKAPGTQGVINTKVTKPTSISKALSPVKEHKVPLSPRSTNVNSKVPLFPSLSQPYSSTEPSPAPESPVEDNWRNRDTISPNGSIPNVSQHLASPQSSKKRKREDNEQQHDRLGTIEATPLSESQTVKPFTLVLLATLSRSQVPLAWLDSASPAMQVPSRLIFDAKLPTNPGSQCTNLNGHVVLVVRPTPNGRLYAVESLGGNMYLGCLLSAWVTEEQVLAGQQNSSENFLLEKVLGAQTGPETREHARTNSQQGTPLHSFRPSPPEPKNRRGVLARMAIMPSKETTPASCSSILPDVHGEEAPSKPGQSPTKTYANGTRDVSSTSAAVPHPDICFVSNKDQSGTLWPALQQSDDPILVDTVEAQLPSTPIILETLHRQYLETLYVSKTSLAYFAKGPLVRARTQVQSLSTSSLSDLAEFCRDSVIPTKKMHQKYGDSIVTILQSLAAVQTPGRVEEAQETSTKPKAKQKSGKQRKVGKDGLYPDEKDLIEAWWHTTSRDLDVPKFEPSSSEMKKAIADLRTRETELQIILILEALALEGAEKATVDDHGTRPLIKEEPAEQGRDAALIHVPQFKKRKRQDLKSELDLLIDRLCIWQTVGLEEISGSTVESQKHGKVPGTGSNDALKDFCSDIIIPFYSARLPEQCKAVCHKLGVSQVTPKRPRKTLQKSLSTTGVLPGAVVRPSCGSISKRTLQRVLSEDQGSRHVSPPTLSRSSTVPLIPNLKREPTEPPSRPESRGGLQKSRSFANREVDLVNDARTQAMKQKKLAKLAKQKQEVDAAIDALRKPNRGLAAKEIADDMEKHRVERAKFSRRNGLAIQVDATPKKSAPKTTRQCAGPRYGEAATLPLPDLSFKQQPVLSSSLRPSTAGRAKDKLQRPTFTNTGPMMISDTPAHAVLKKSDPLGIAKRTENFEIFDTRNDKWDYSNQTCSQAESLVEATPSANRVRRDMLTNIQNTPLRMRKSQKPVLFTALDKADVTIDDTFKDAPEIPEQAGKAMARVMGGGSEMSIYDSLGWNDDLDE